MTKSTSGDKIVVEGTEQGSVFPTSREETAKDIVIDGRKSPFDVRSGAYSNNLSIVGPGTVRGPVLAGRSLRLEAESPNIQRFLSGISAQDSIVAQPIGDDGLDSSPATTVDGVRFIIRGDVASAKVSLRNALVIGSVTAPSIRLENSIVLGSVLSRRSPGEFHAVCSTFGLYDVRQLIIEGPTTIITPGGVSDEEPRLIPHKLSAKKQLPPAIRLLSLCRLDPPAACGTPNTKMEHFVEGLEDAEKQRFVHVPGISCEYWLHQVCGYQHGVSMFKTDFAPMLVESTGENRLRISGDSRRGISASGLRRRWFFGVQSRALHVNNLEERDARYRSILHRIFAYEHLDEKNRQQLRADINGEHISYQETQLFNLAIENLDSRF